MKRSEYIAIGAVGLMIAAVFWPRADSGGIAGPEETISPDAQAFNSPEECRVTPGMTTETCERAFAAARQSAVAEAPRFESQTSCEAQYGAGQCRTSTWNGTSVFVPALIGALVGRSLANTGAFQSQPLYPPRTGPAACPQGPNTPGQPECAQAARSGGGAGAIGSGRTYSTGRGTTVSRAPGPDARVRVDARPRGGFTSPSGGASPSGNTVSRNGFGSTGRSVSSGT